MAKNLARLKKFKHTNPPLPAKDPQAQLVAVSSNLVGVRAINPLCKEIRYPWFQREDLVICTRGKPKEIEAIGLN